MIVDEIHTCSVATIMIVAITTMGVVTNAAPAGTTTFVVTNEAPAQTTIFVEADACRWNTATGSMWSMTGAVTA